MWNDIFTFLRARFVKRKLYFKFFFLSKMAIRKRPPKATKNVLYDLSTDGSGVKLLCPPPSSWCVMCIHGRKRSFQLDACGY